MLIPRFVRELSVDPRQHPRGQEYLSSASGLALAHGRFYVVADDEQHLGWFDASGIPQPLTLWRLFDGDLPPGKKQRKAAKRDLETLAALPALQGCPHGALLALGSGSRPTRELGVLLSLPAPDAHGALGERFAQIDLSALYAPLRERFPDLNVEGAFVASGELRLLQRGNKGDARNACISFDWNQIAPWLLGRRSNAPAVKSVQIIELDKINGVPLGLTDGAALEGGCWVFSAVAEDTRNSNADGACAGSAIGLVGPDGDLLALHMLRGAPKVEGIHARAIDGGWTLGMVTDADDPSIASQLLELTLPWPQAFDSGAPDAGRRRDQG